MAVAADERLHMEDLANRPRTHDLLNGQEIGVPAAVLVDGECQHALLCEANEVVGLSGGEAEGLLDDDMLPGEQQLARQGGVGVGWRTDDGDLYRLVGEDIIKLGDAA